MNRVSDDARRAIVKVAASLSALFLLTDFVYSKIHNISYANREECILYKFLPRPGFLFMEYVLELAMLVFMGIFIATVLERCFSKFKRLYPRNVVAAFIFASILPVCACSVIPLIRSLQGKLSFRSIITFVVSAPLLSPYIILLSLSVIGVEYAACRIIASFLLAASAGWVLEFFHNRMNPKHNLQTGPVLFAGGGCSEMGAGADGCSGCAAAKDGGCRPQESDIFLKTWSIFREVLPYIAVAGAAGIALEFVSLGRLLLDWDIDNSFLSVLAAVLVGIPVYFCSGVEILFLRPLMHTAGFSMGTAIAFSLSSTSICLTSGIMLLKFLGKGLTAILVAYLFVATLVIGYLINLTAVAEDTTDSVSVSGIVLKGDAAAGEGRDFEPPPTNASIGGGTWNVTGTLILKSPTMVGPIFDESIRETPRSQDPSCQGVDSSPWRLVSDSPQFLQHRRKTAQLSFTENPIPSPAASSVTVSPSRTLPLRISRESGFSTCFWMARFRGRAP